MPEGHTIHRLATDQSADLAGRAVQASSPQGRFETGAALIDGQVLEEVEAWGKHLFHRYADGQILWVHLGLIGKFRRMEIDAEQQGAIRLRLAHGKWAWELVGPMRCELVSADERADVIDGLGPDPLRPDADASDFAERLGRRRIPIGAALLEQSVLAGVGNVYRSEIPFLCGIDPHRPSNGLDEVEVESIWATVVEMLELGQRLNRIVTVTGADAAGPVERLKNSERLYVYKRFGEPCRRCATPIASGEIAGRKSWWCPQCQA